MTSIVLLFFLFVVLNLVSNNTGVVLADSFIDPVLRKTGYTCGTAFIDVDFGTLLSVEECAEEAFYDYNCTGDEIMFAESTGDCSCCSLPDPDITDESSKYIVNTAYNVYDFMADYYVDDDESTYTDDDIFENCMDIPGWVDSFGDDCAWYAEYGECDSYGDEFANNVTGLTDVDACCACGGGQPLVPTASPTVCVDTPGWTDSFGDGCLWYETDYGSCDLDLGENENCCFCKEDGDGDDDDFLPSCPDGEALFELYLLEDDLDWEVLNLCEDGEPVVFSSDEFSWDETEILECLSVDIEYEFILHSDDDWNVTDSYEIFYDDWWVDNYEEVIIFGADECPTEEPSTCNDLPLEFENEVYVEIEFDDVNANLDANEIQILQDDFVTSYNALARRHCDPEFHVISNVTIDPTPLATTHGRGERSLGRYSYIYKIKGTCRKCSSLSSFFDGAIRRRRQRRQLSSETTTDNKSNLRRSSLSSSTTPTSSSFANNYNEEKRRHVKNINTILETPRRERELQTEEVCTCPDKPIHANAPGVDEFEKIYNHDIEEDYINNALFNDKVTIVDITGPGVDDGV